MQKKKFRQKPEALIQSALIDFLAIRGWYTMETHGNMYQRGFPDIYATHSKYGVRWIEVKNPLAWNFTVAQRECFPKLLANGTRIWVLVAATDEEYAKLFQPCNAWQFLLEKC